MANWYVSTLGGQTGADGSEENPWTLAQAIVAINAGTIVNGDTVWVKADGIYETTGVTISSAGTYGQPWKNIKGYNLIIGDKGKATIKRSSGTTTVINISVGYWIIENFIIDGNLTGGKGLTQISTVMCRNIETKNCTDGISNAGVAINCYSHDNTNVGIGVGTVINCIVVGNLLGLYNCPIVINSIAKDSSSYNIYSSGLVLNSISDGGTGDGIYAVSGCNVINAIIRNSPAGKHGLKLHSILGAVAIYSNINFDNCNQKCNAPLSLIDIYYELDSQFNNPANLDYTRTGNNLDNIGLSKVGLLDSSFDYNIDIGIDQKAAISEQGYVFIS